MVWLAEKKIFHYILDMGFERVEIPVRVKYELAEVDGNILSDIIKKVTIDIQVKDKTDLTNANRELKIVNPVYNRNLIRVPTFQGYLNKKSQKYFYNF